MSRVDFGEITRNFFFNNSTLNVQMSEGQLFKATAHESQLATGTPQEYDFQKAIRPLFGKQGLNTNGMGSHPDFLHLENCDHTENHYIATLFLDIKRSSRLNLLLPLKQAAIVKNRILQAAIDVVRSFDGVPHRLMGDALMAFFGGKSICKEDAIVNAINASNTLRLIMRDYVFPSLNERLSTDIELAVRVGLDFGDTDEILWSCYGFGNATEVTAHGLQVDFASKLQSQARSNSTMLGQTLINFIDFPKEYSEIKESAGQQELHVKPNITDQNGNSINYSCRLIKGDHYQRLLPFPPEVKSGKQDIPKLRSNSAFSFSCEVYDTENDWVPYPSLSRCLDKGLSLKFRVQVRSAALTGMGKLKVEFYKHNHGNEAEKENSAQEHITGTKYLSPTTNPKYRQPDRVHEATLDEYTSYRGLHTMRAKVSSERDSGNVLFEDWIGVYIK
ncbi:MAG: hypothetical protein C0623_13535 [Desulfuromonas sp.]|nr:MAG: hypothetical protein C0623_13535 [Desulfuromonas sp.]